MGTLQGRNRSQGSTHEEVRIMTKGRIVILRMGRRSGAIIGIYLLSGIRPNSIGANIICQWRGVPRGSVILGLENLLWGDYVRFGNRNWSQGNFSLTREHCSHSITYFQGNFSLTPIFIFE